MSMGFALLSYWNLTYGGNVKIKLLGLPLELHSHSKQSGSNKAINNGEIDNHKFISPDQVKRLKNYNNIKKENCMSNFFLDIILFCEFRNKLSLITQLSSFLRSCQYFCKYYTMT